MPSVTFDWAQSILEGHGHDVQRCENSAEHIMASCLVGYRDGSSETVWERLPLDYMAIRDWLGY